VTTIPVLYVFVDIKIDLSHFIETVQHNFKPHDVLTVACTIQFSSSLQAARKTLLETFPNISIPQAKPLSRGEVLGCTSPELGSCDAVIFLADGRFHLESAMIQNPHVGAFFKYDPYSKRLTRERYDHAQMHGLRRHAIEQASQARKFGIILGSLGRQGSLHILDKLEQALTGKGIPYVIVLLSEIFPGKLARFRDVDAWVQVACPRLSIDWGYAFPEPLLSPYEAMVCFERTVWKPVYPMDFYRENSGEWTNYHHRSGGAAIPGAPECKSVTRSNRLRPKKEIQRVPIGYFNEPSAELGATCSCSTENVLPNVPLVLVESSPVHSDSTGNISSSTHPVYTQTTS
jgi:2-(3-amino-3-carboxypropyl)histidine synthase